MSSFIMAGVGADDSNVSGDLRVGGNVFVSSGNVEAAVIGNSSTILQGNGAMLSGLDLAISTLRADLTGNVTANVVRVDGPTTAGTSFPMATWSGSSYKVGINAQNAGGAYNPIVNLGDGSVVTFGASKGAGRAVLTTWSDARAGLSIGGDGTSELAGNSKLTLTSANVVVAGEKVKLGTGKDSWGAVTVNNIAGVSDYVGLLDVRQHDRFHPGAGQKAVFSVRNSDGSSGFQVQPSSASNWLYSTGIMKTGDCRVASHNSPMLLMHSDGTAHGSGIRLDRANATHQVGLLGNVGISGNLEVNTPGLTVTSGRLGIGNAAPAHALSVDGTSYTKAAATFASGVNVQGGSTVSPAGINFIAGDPGVMIEKRWSGAGDRYGLGSYAFGTTRVYAASTYTHATVRLCFPTSETEFTDVLTCTKWGNVGIGNAAPAHTLSVQGTSYLNGTLAVTGAVSSVDRFVVLGKSGTGAASGVSIEGEGPSMRWVETDQGADGKEWNISATNGNLRIAAINDANNGLSHALVVKRSGLSVTAMDFGDGLLNVPFGFLGSGTATFGGGLAVTGAATAASFSGSGAGLTGLAAGAVTTGQLDNPRLPTNVNIGGTLNANGAASASSFSGSGAGLTGLAAGAVTTGQLDNPRLPTNVNIGGTLNANGALSTSSTCTAASFVGPSLTSAATLVLGAGGSEKARIDTSGLLGIGCFPERAFSVAGGNWGFQENGVERLIIWGTAASSSKSSIAGNAAATGGYLRFSTGTNAERMRIDPAGNVGIGNAAPAHMLSVEGTSYLNGNVTAPGFAVAGQGGTFLNSNGISVVATNPDGAKFGMVGWLGRTGAGNVGLTFSQAGVSAFGILHPTGGGLSFWNNRYPSSLGGGGGGAAGTELMKIDSSGRLGIGNANPAHTLSVQGTSYLNGAATATSSLAVGGTLISGARVSVGNETLAGTGTPETLSLGGTYNSGGNGYNPKLKLLQTTGGLLYGLGVSSGSLDYVTDASARHSWYTGGSTPVEKMRLDSNGLLGIGCVPTRVFSVAGGNWGFQENDVERGIIWGTSAKSAIAGSAAATGGYLRFSTGTNAERMRIDPAGNVGIGTAAPAYQLHLSTDSAAKPSSTTWTVSSDRRVKLNIEDANVDLCYSVVRDLPLRRFTYDPAVFSDDAISDRSVVGWIAQEVQAVLPKAVSESSQHGYSDFLSLDADQVYKMMYGALQKVIADKEALADRVAALESRVAALEGAA